MKVASIEVMRGFAVSIVIAYHMFAVQERYFGVNVLPEAFKYGGWGVDIFFVISGVVMFKSTFGRATPVAPWPFLRARISRIYPPYWVITFVIFGIYLVEPSMVNSSYDTQPSVLRSLLLLPDVTTPWLNVGWSLVYEMWFYLLLAILLIFDKKITISALVSYAIFLLLAPDFSSFGPVLALVADALILEFMIGFLIGVIFFDPSFQKKRSALLALATGCVLLGLGLASFGAELSGSRFDRLATYGLAAIAAVSIVLCFETTISRERIFQPVIFIGTISYSVYLTHVLFLNAFLYTALRVLQLDLSPIIANLACFAFTLLGGSLYYLAFEKTLSQYFKRLLGGSLVSSQHQGPRPSEGTGQ